MGQMGKPKEMSELRRRRLAFVEAAGGRPYTKAQFDKIAEFIVNQPGHEQAMAEADAAFAEFEKASKTSELRRSNPAPRNTSSRSG